MRKIAYHWIPKRTEIHRMRSCRQGREQAEQSTEDELRIWAVTGHLGWLFTLTTLRWKHPEEFALITRY